MFSFNAPQNCIHHDRIAKMLEEKQHSERNPDRKMLDHRPSLDLTMTHFERVLGDIKLYGTWYGTEVADSEPCLVLTPAHRTAGFKPCVVCLSVAWKWNEAAYAAARSVAFCDALGIAPGPRNCARVANIIHDHLDDLVKMPPRPHRYVIVGGTGHVRTGDGKITTSEIIHKV